jgi:hypothetical protein
MNQLKQVVIVSLCSLIIVNLPYQQDRCIFQQRKIFTAVENRKIFNPEYFQMY